MKALHLVIFTVSGRLYALPASEVNEVLRAVRVTPLPDAPQFIAGVINVRGSVLPVIDMRRRFGLTEALLSRGTRIIAAEFGGCRAGLIVDGVSGVTSAAEGDIGEDPSETLGREIRRFVSAVVKTDSGLALALDTGTLFTAEELSALSAAPEAGNEDKQ